MDKDSDWTVVQSRSVRSDWKEKVGGVASRRDDGGVASRRDHTTARGGEDKIGQPIRLHPDRGIRQTPFVPTVAYSSVRGVLVLPAPGTAQVRGRGHGEGEEVRRRSHGEEVRGRGHGEEVRRLELESELEWPSISEPFGLTSVEEAESPWSAVVRRPPPIAVKQEGGGEGGTPANGEGGTNGGKTEEKGRKKAKQEPRQPLMLEFGSMLEALKDHKGSGRLVLGGGVTLPPRATPGKREVQKPVNVLDSSAPSMRRGKEREGPKKRKASALRKVIEKEKAERLHQDASSHVDGEDLRPRPPGLDMASPHSKKFREYCYHLPSQAINDTTQQLLADLVRFQDRQFQKDPVKSKAKRRYVCGLREVKKHLELMKIKCVIVAPNLDRIHSPGGIDDIVESVLDQCKEQSVPTVFALSRRRLGYVMKKSHKVGCVGIFSYDGAEECFKRLMKLVAEAQEQYEARNREMDGLLVDSEYEGGHDPSSPWDVFLPPSAVGSLATDTGPVIQASSSGSFELNAHAPTFVPKSCLFDAL